MRPNRLTNPQVWQVMNWLLSEKTQAWVHEHRPTYEAVAEKFMETLGSEPEFRVNRANITGLVNDREQYGLTWPDGPPKRKPSKTTRLRDRVYRLEKLVDKLTLRIETLENQIGSDSEDDDYEEEEEFS